MGTTRSTKSWVQVWLCVCLGVVLVVSRIHVVVGAPKIHIPDELDDVEDNEEDEEWKAWGKPKSVPIMDGPPPDPPEDPEALVQYQLDMMKRQTGPSMGFVKLRLGVQRKPDESTRLAEKWTELLKTGSINAKIYAVDRATIMFILSHGQDTTEVKDFVLSQDEAYEFKLGNAAFRRPGDPPLEVVVEKLEEEKRAVKKAQKAAEKKAAEEKDENVSFKEEL